MHEMNDEGQQEAREGRSQNTGQSAAPVLIKRKHVKKKKSSLSKKEQQKGQQEARQARRQQTQANELH